MSQENSSATTTSLRSVSAPSDLELNCYGEFQTDRITGFSHVYYGPAQLANNGDIPMLRTEMVDENCSLPMSRTASLPTTSTD
jgi:hypothetical protein